MKPIKGSTGGGAVSDSRGPRAARSGSGDVEVQGVDVARLAHGVIIAVEHGDVDALADLRDGLSVINRVGSSSLVARLLTAIQAELAAGEAPPAGNVFEPSSLPIRMLSAIQAEPELSSRELCARLQVSEAQVSRTGKGLVERHLAMKRQRGRTVRWLITSEGRRTVLESTSMPRDVAKSVAAKLKVLRTARDESRFIEAAESLIELGLHLRVSANPRGSMLASAPGRLSGLQESGLVELLDRVSPGLEVILAECLGEWGSDRAVEAIAARIAGLDWDSERPAPHFIEALGNIGGPRAALSLADVMDRALKHGHLDRETHVPLVGAISSLITGGRDEATEAAVPFRLDLGPELSSRNALEVVDAVDEALTRLASTRSAPGYSRERALRSLGDLAHWRTALTDVREPSAMGPSELGRRVGAGGFQMVGPVFVGTASAEEVGIDVDREGSPETELSVQTDLPPFIRGRITAVPVGHKGAVYGFIIHAKIDPEKLPDDVGLVDAYGLRHRVAVEGDTLTALVATVGDSVADDEDLQMQIRFTQGPR